VGGWKEKNHLKKPWTHHFPIALAQPHTAEEEKHQRRGREEKLTELFFAHHNI
jgi:hypothetical protein